MMSGRLCCSEAFAEMAIARVIHAPFVSSVLRTHDTVAGIVRPIALADRVAEYPAKQPHRPSGSALSTGDNRPSSQLRLDVGGGFSGNHVALEFAGIDGGEFFARLFPDQGDDVSVDPASVCVERADAFGLATPGQNQSRLSLGQIFTAKFLDHHG